VVKVERGPARHEAGAKQPPSADEADDGKDHGIPPESGKEAIEMIRSRVVLFCLSIGLVAVLMPAAAFAGGAAEHNTFTKWITTAPNMAGVVGGAVGDGSYAGEILKMTPGDTTVIEALYHLNGSAHSSTLLVHVEQTGLKAVISGVVTEGWLKGSKVKGEYTQITSPLAPGDGTAFQGTLDLMGAQ
jgi:hypothetical protein